MAVASITVTDTPTGIDIKVVFDPETPEDPKDFTQAQTLIAVLASACVDALDNTTKETDDGEGDDHV